MPVTFRTRTTDNFYYNFGRPLENYRDKFQDIAKQALQEHFEVVSVTFQDEKVNSKATEEYGWRVTPYAYILLKRAVPRSTRSLRCGWISISWTPRAMWFCPSSRRRSRSTHRRPRAPVRPFEKLQIIQTLDERQAKDGKLILEVKATALGLVPDLDTIVYARSPRIPGREDRRSGGLGFEIRPRQRGDPDRFRAHLAGRVPRGRRPGEASRDVSIRLGEGRWRRARLSALRRRRPGQGRAGGLARIAVRPAAYAWLGWIGGGLLALALAAASIWKFRSGPRRRTVERFQMPELVTPFSVLGLLREIQHKNGFSAPKRKSWPARSSASSATTSRKPTAMRSTFARSPRPGFAGRREVAFGGSGDAVSVFRRGNLWGVL